MQSAVSIQKQRDTACLLYTSKPVIDLSKLEERVILAAVSTSETDQAESSLDELKELADTAGAKTVGRVIQNLSLIHILYKKSQSIMYIGDKENSNTDSALVSTKRSLIFNELNKSLYQKFFMTVEELQACREGYIYIHDMSARRDTMNLSLIHILPG